MVYDSILMTKDENAKVEKKIMEELNSRISLLSHVPVTPLLEHQDIVERDRYRLNGKWQKHANGGIPSMADLEKETVFIKTEEESSPLISLPRKLLLMARASGVAIENYVNTMVLDGLIENENKRVMDVFNTTTVTESFEWSSAEIKTKLNDVLQLSADMKQAKVPMVRPTFMIAPADIAQFGYTSELNSGFARLKSDFKLELVENPDLTPGTAYFYDNNPRILEFPMNIAPTVVKVLPDTDRPTSDDWFIIESFGGKILHDVGVVKITFT